MKLIIAGGRDYWLTREDFAKLDAIHQLRHVHEVVCGMAAGADACGYCWATFNGIAVVKFYPDWDGLGKRAGFVRNREMALYAEALAVFPGGNGTAHMVEQAQARGLNIFDFRP